MSEELLTLEDLSNLYRCSYRHARDVITKTIGFPTLAPGSTQRNPLWLRDDVREFLRKKPHDSRI